MKEVTNSINTVDHKDIMIQSIQTFIQEINFEEASMSIFQSNPQSQVPMDSRQIDEDEDEQNAILIEEDDDSLDILKQNITGCQNQSVPTFIDRFHSRQDDKTNLLSSYRIQIESIQQTNQDDMFNIINVKERPSICQKFYNQREKESEYGAIYDNQLLGNGKEEPKQQNELTRIQQFYQQPQSSNEGNDNKIRFGQIEENILIDDERSVTSTQNDSNSFPILIKNAFQMRFYQQGTKLKIFSIIFIVVLVLNNSVDLVIGQNLISLNSILADIQSLAHLQYGLSTIIVTLNIKLYLQFLEVPHNQLLDLLEFTYQENQINNVELISKLLIENNNYNSKVIRASYENTIEVENLKLFKSNQSMLIFNSTFKLYKYLIEDVQNEMIQLNESINQNKFRDNTFNNPSIFNIILNFAKVIQQLDGMIQSVNEELTMKLIDHQKFYLYNFIACQLILALLLLIISQQLLIRERMTRNLLFTYQKFKPVDIETLIGKGEGFQYLHSQSTFINNSIEVRRATDHFQKLLQLSNQQLRYKVYLILFILSIFRYFLNISLVQLFFFSFYHCFQFQTQSENNNQIQNYKLQISTCFKSYTLRIWVLFNYYISHKLQLKNQLNERLTRKITIELVGETQQSLSDMELEISDEELLGIKLILQEDICQDFQNYNRTQLSRYYTLKNSLNGQCSLKLNGMLSKGLARYLVLIKQFFNENLALEYSNITPELLINSKFFIEFFEAEIISRIHIKKFSEYLLDLFSQKVQTFISINLVINSVEVSCVLTFIIALLFELIQMAQQRQKLAWSLLQMFSIDMLSQNEYFKTFLSRQRGSLN